MLRYCLKKTKTKTKKEFKILIKAIRHYFNQIAIDQYVNYFYSLNISLLSLYEWLSWIFLLVSSSPKHSPLNFLILYPSLPIVEGGKANFKTHCHLHGIFLISTSPENSKNCFFLYGACLFLSVYVLPETEIIP